jgi:hypothetical protein
VRKLFKLTFNVNKVTSMKKHILLFPFFVLYTLTDYTMETNEIYDPQPEYLDLEQQNKELARLLGHISIPQIFFILDDKQDIKELSSATESSASEEELEPNQHAGNVVRYRGKKEPIEAFYRKRCARCSALFWHPRYYVPPLKKHYNKYHPHTKTLYFSYEKPTVFYTLYARCPLWGQPSQTRKYLNGCTHFYHKEKGSLQDELRIPELFVEHYKRVHDITISKNELKKIIEITRKRYANIKKK